MKTYSSARKNFVRQLNTHDCGIACLSMILNFAGKIKEAQSIRQTESPYDDGLTLLRLKDIAAACHLKARCVRFEFGNLRSVTSPCILHLINAFGQDHFEVFFPGKKGNYMVMADPATQVYYIKEDDLRKKWVSQAALYFEGLKPSNTAIDPRHWLKLFRLEILPGAFWITLPVLNLTTSLLGVTLSWVLQRGISDSLVNKSSGVIIALGVLLLILTIFKSVFSYIRQRILIELNNSLNKHLVSNLVKYLSQKNRGANRDIKNDFKEIQKIQNALSIFLATILSDGSLVLLILAGIFYSNPLTGMINSLFLMVTIGTISCRSQSFLYDNAYLNQLKGNAEDDIISEIKRSYQAGIKAPGFSRLTHSRYLLFARNLAIGISKINLLYEWMSTFSIFVVLSYEILRLKKDATSYSEFLMDVIFSYFLTILTQKICAAVFVWNEGIEAARQYFADFSE